MSHAPLWHNRQAPLMQRLKRLLHLFFTSPGYVISRLGREVAMEADRWRLPLVCRWLTPHRLALLLGHHDIDGAWQALAGCPFPFVTKNAVARDFVSSEACEEIMARAERAMARQIDLLGSGPFTLATPVDWYTDPKVGHTWPAAFCRRIEYTNKDRPSDVKMPWEISRLQWLIPVGQAYVLSGDDRYAAFARSILEEWIDANPVAFSVNWSCTMEPALRILTWVWFFHVFSGSSAWLDAEFRTDFLRMLYLHGVFVERHIERAQINGNHYVADATGMVWAGLFFDTAVSARRWRENGWQILSVEIQTQVYKDGVDFEASCAYHRLVAELFWIAAHYRTGWGQAQDESFNQRLAAMANVTRHLCRVDGSTPNWGDADDGRALPLGLQALSDHRYLCDLISLTLGSQAGVTAEQGGEFEVHWVFGPRPKVEPQPVTSKAFPDGGLFVLRDANMHITIDCGPVGLAGLGGHGHNDALSFEMWSDGHLLIADPGSFVYTADFAARNRFRFTASHNTPQIGDHEINRTYAPDNLWSLHDDARCKMIDFESNGQVHLFVGRHFGYARLDPSVIVERKILLDSRERSLVLEDRFAVSGDPDGLTVHLPLHFAPGVSVAPREATGGVVLSVSGRRYLVETESAGGLSSEILPAEFSPSYGVKIPCQKLVTHVPLAGGLVLKTRITAAG